jgi:hypothetical protein
VRVEERVSRPGPTVEEPTPETLMAWADEGRCQATDGCWLTDADACEHGHPSWAIVLGIAPALDGE